MTERQEQMIYDEGFRRGYEKGKADRPQEWIPCSERLPDDDTVVLVAMDSKSRFVWEEQRFIEFGKIDKERGWLWLNESACDYWEATDMVVAWMPLPKPYMKGADDE